MTAATQGGDPPPELIQTRRLEITDAQGLVRAVLGDIGTPASPAIFGFAVFDADGRQRAWLALHDTGPALVFDQGGNDAVHIGVDDDHPEAVRTGAFLHLCDADGRAVLSVWVEEDGAVGIRTGGSRER
jgi:hypothetical protein